MLSLERQNQLREIYRAEHPGWRPATEVYATLVHEQVQPGHRLLDLGCGRGGLVEQLSHPLNHITGLDPDLTSLRQHRLAHKRPPFPRVAALSDRLPFARDSFDLVFSSWVLEHLAQPAADLAQIGRILRPGGVMVFITPNKRHPLATFNRTLSRAGRLQNRIVPRFYGRAPADAFPAYYRANTRHDLERLARSGGMHLAQLQAIADPTYLAFNPALYRLACWLDARLPASRGIHLVGVLKKP